MFDERKLLTRYSRYASGTDWGEIDPKIGSTTFPLNLYFPKWKPTLLIVDNLFFCCAELVVTFGFMPRTKKRQGLFRPRPPCIIRGAKALQDMTRFEDRDL